jgi:hypothetical protein
MLGPGLDLEYETDVQSLAPEPALYETAYVTSHKGNCRAGAFSSDGQLVATGSVDASIKVPIHLCIILLQCIQGYISTNCAQFNDLDFRCG